MNNRKKSLITFVLTIFVVGSIGTSGLNANEFNNNPVADEMIGSSGITWVPKINYQQLVLTISRPDGTVFSKTIESGSTTYVGLSEIFGSNFNDGAYTYQLLVIPVVETKIRTEQHHLLTSGSKNEKTHYHKGLTQSGGFLIKDGAIVTRYDSEPENNLNLSGSQEGLSGTLDQVIIDDLIVDGSACIGLDCVNGESFGFDTLRLKENNLRIKFQDTSTSASFPSNDWQLTANDSSNGGQNKFSIDDIDGGRTPFTIEAGAPSHSLYVDDGGRLGLGTSTPVVDMHAVSGNTPTLRLEQDGSSGFTPQTWDVAGNETNFFVRDATNGSLLPFKIKPGAPTNSLFIASDGKIGFGTASPGYKVEVETTGENAGLYLDRTDGATFKLNVTNSLAQIGSVSAHKVNFVVGNSAKMTISTVGYVGIGDTTPSYPIEVSTANGARLETSGNWVNPSSRKLKENIESLTAEEAIDTLNGLSPVKYNYKVDKTEGYVGFIAEEVPDLVSVRDKKGMVTMDVVAVLTKVVQEQQKMAQEQKKTISELKKEIAELKKK